MRGVGAYSVRMPARDLIAYCADCDATRLALADGASGDAERAAVLSASPRRLAMKHDVDGSALCVKCLEQRRENRRIELSKRELGQQD